MPKVFSAHASLGRWLYQWPQTLVTSGIEEAVAAAREAGVTHLHYEVAR